MKTRAKPLGIRLLIDSPENLNAKEVFGAIFQHPGSNGAVRDFTDLITLLHEYKAIGILCANPLCLDPSKGTRRNGRRHRSWKYTAMACPSATGTTCRLHGRKGAYKRSMPGRIVGISIDPRQQSIPPCASNARTTYPAGESDI